MAIEKQKQYKQKGKYKYITFRSDVELENAEAREIIENLPALLKHVEFSVSFLVVLESNPNLEKAFFKWSKIKKDEMK